MLKKNINLSKYKNVFCESTEALDWAYKNGLNKEAIIKSSSPAMIWGDNINVQHVESFWTLDNIKAFQSKVEKYSIDIYNSIINIPCISHEEALCVTRDVIRFDRVLFKAACLTKEDLNTPVLFISLSGKFGPGHKSINPPWSSLLQDNSDLLTINYNLNSKYTELTTKGVNWFYRVFLAGYETILFRVIQKIYSVFSLNFLKKQVIVPRDNELISDISYQLSIRGVKVNMIECDINSSSVTYSDKNKTDIFSKIQPIVSKRFNEWALNDLSTTLFKMLCVSLTDSLNIFAKSKKCWEDTISYGSYNPRNTVLLSSVLSTNTGCGMSNAFRSNKIPIVSVQHGVSPEISENKGARSMRFDSSLSDCSIVFNEAMKKTNELSYFSIGTTFVSGISARHLRVSKKCIH